VSETLCLKHLLELPAGLEMVIMNNVRILFDEFGTPTFRNDREFSVFGGIATAYYQTDEENLIAKCDKLFGLSSSQPKKNRHISAEEAIDIARLVTTLPLYMVINILTLDDEALKETATIYEPLSNEIRTKYRGVRERPLSQYLHGRLLDSCVLKCISSFLVRQPVAQFRCEIHVDNWAIPASDKEIFVKDRAQSLQHSIRLLLTKIGLQTQLGIPDLSILDRDSALKRFIDVLASITNRAYFTESNEKRSSEPLDLLRKGMGSVLDLENITYDEIKLMNHFIEEMNELR